MGRTIITTCGTSLLTASAWTDPKCFNGPALAQIADQEDRYSMGSDYAAFTAQFPQAADLAAQFAKTCWDDINLIGKLPAELASLRALQHYYESTAQPPQPLGDGDQVIFLSSDNADGRFCYDCLAAILKNNKLLPGVQLTPKEIPGLDPQDPKKFQEALQQMWAFCHSQGQGLTPNDRLILNLTGGYKAMGLVLAALSTVVQITPPPSIIYLYETAGPEQLLIYSYNRNNTITDWLIAGFYEPTTARQAIAGAL